MTNVVTTNDTTAIAKYLMVESHTVLMNFTCRLYVTHLKICFIVIFWLVIQKGMTGTPFALYCYSRNMKALMKI